MDTNRSNNLTASTHRPRGRFAPSPTGKLHFGSLVAAVGSFLQAKSNGGAWLVRMEDLDKPREIPGAASHILRTLEAFGLYWYEAVLYQSQRLNAYRTTFEALYDQDSLYPCHCSRKSIEQCAHFGPVGYVYPGTCRNHRAPMTESAAWRIRTDDQPIQFADGIQGLTRHCLESESGDFVLRRADGIFTYQLAVVIDDAEQNITEVVRGADLLDITARQIFLQQLLGVPTPSYSHPPIALTVQGEKLSKQTGATPITADHAVPTLVKALRFLGQTPPAELPRVDLNDFWQWALTHWDPKRIPRSSEPMLVNELIATHET